MKKSTPENSIEEDTGGHLLGWRDHFAALTVTTPKLELVVADDDTLDRLGEAAGDDITPAARSPFRSEWDQLTPGERKEYVVGRQHALWESFTLSNWSVPFTIMVKGVPVGEVAVRAQRFREDKTFSTSMWLVDSMRGKGLGLETRVAALQFGFGALTAERALTMSFQENLPALAINKKLKYELSGASLFVNGKKPVRRLIHYRLDRRKWEGYVRRKDVHMEGMCVHFP